MYVGQRFNVRRSMIDSTSSCPLVVNLYSTLGGISLYACLSRMPPFLSSFSRIASVLLLMPRSVCLNFIYRTGSVVQHSGISRVPLFVINLRSFAVSVIRDIAPESVLK